MKLWKIHIIILFVVWNAIKAQCQVRQVGRIEFELDLFDNYSVNNFGEQGVYIHDYEINKDLKEMLITYTKFNTDLKNSGVKRIAVNYRKQSLKTFIGEERHDFFIHDERKGYLTLVEMNPGNFEISKFKTRLLPKFELSKVIVNNGVAVLTGINKKQLKIFKWKLGESHVKQISTGGLSEKNAEFKDLYTSNDNELHLVIKNCEEPESCKNLIFRFDSLGNRIKSAIELKDTNDVYLNRIQTTTLDSVNAISFGTFSQSKYSDDYGIFTVPFNNGDKGRIKTYDFLELNNFLTFLSERSQEKMSEKYEKKKMRGKDLDVSFKVLPHALIRKNGQNIMVMEIYYPTYVTISQTVMINGVPSIQTQQVFDGYQYTHAAVVAFDDQGKLLWSNAFKMWLKTKPFEARAFLAIKDKNETLDFIYSDAGSIISLRMKNGEIVEEKIETAMSTDNQEERIRRTIDSETHYWYDNYFLTIGIQKIKDRSRKAGEKRRRVFYMSKLEY